MLIQNFVVSLLLSHTLSARQLSNNCSQVKLQTDPPVNLTEYTRASWYIQQQQLTSYQSLQDLYCVTATYNEEPNAKVPFFRGKVISVYNYANRNEVNGRNEGSNRTILCARVKNESEPEKLIVAPCFLPNLLGGPYDILAAGPEPDNYEWAIVIGGQPTVYMGNNTCTTTENRINNSGLWLFSRKRILEDSAIRQMYSILQSQNISTIKLNNVVQEGCEYEGAFIKSNNRF